LRRFLRIVVLVAGRARRAIESTLTREEDGGSSPTEATWSLATVSEHPRLCAGDRVEGGETNLIRKIDEARKPPLRTKLRRLGHQSGVGRSKSGDSTGGGRTGSTSDAAIDGVYSL
jgi:hypothetical protein